MARMGAITMKSIMIAATAGMLAASLPSMAYADCTCTVGFVNDETPVGEVTDGTGTVLASDATGFAKPATLGMTLFNGWSVKTGADGNATVTIYRTVDPESAGCSLDLKQSSIVDLYQEGNNLCVALRSTNLTTTAGSSGVNGATVAVAGAVIVGGATVVIVSGGKDPVSDQ